MRLYFEELQRRFLERVSERVHNGELTERGLARLAGISQPHIHNVLKGVRNLSPELIDLVFKCQDLSVLDLCTAPELRAHLERLSTVPQPVFDLAFLSSPVGPGQPWSDTLNSEDRMTIPCTVEKIGQKLALARLRPDPDMRESTQADSFAVLDLSERDGYSPDVLYVVDRGHDAVLRRIRPGLGKVYLVPDNEVDCPGLWEPIAAPRGPASVVRARVCRFGKLVEREEIAAKARSAPRLAS